MADPANLAQSLEGILRKHLKCHYLDFGIKANDNLLRDDWKSPVNFALGHRYALSHNDEKVKEDINDFLGDKFIGQHIMDVVDNYEDYGLNSPEEAVERVREIINEIRDLLQS